MKGSAVWCLPSLAYPDCAVTLIGEKERASYQAYLTPAHRYLPVHETADAVHYYGKLHPSGKCLLKTGCAVCGI